MCTACQGICINIETSLESFLSIYFIIYFSLYIFSHSAYIVADFFLTIKIEKDNFSATLAQTIQDLTKVVQHLCRCYILNVLQCLVVPINMGPYCILTLGMLSPLIPCPAGSIYGYKLLFEEELELLPG